MKHNLLLSVMYSLVLALVFGCTSTRYSTSNISSNLEIRYDGLYCRFYEDYTSYLRFYKDGTVISVSSTGSPEDLKKWFNAPYENSGTYSNVDNIISFETTSSVGTVSYHGKILKDRLVLDRHSYINGKDFKAEEYIFVVWINND